MHPLDYGPNNRKATCSYVFLIYGSLFLGLTTKYVFEKDDVDLQFHPG